MKENSMLKRIYRILYITFLASAMSVILDNVILVPIEYHLYMVLIVIFIVIADVIRIFRRNRMLYIIIAAVTLVAGILCLQPVVCCFIQDTITYAEYGCYISEADKSAYTVLITFVMAVASAVLSYVICLFRYVRIAVPVVLLTVCIVCRINGFDISHIALAAILYTFMVSITELICIIAKNSRSIAIYMTPVFLAFCIVVAIIPVTDKPLEWTRTRMVIDVVEDKAEGIWDSIIRFLGFEDSDEGILSGYSGGKRMDFCDSVADNDTVQLSLTGRPVQSNMYIRGACYNIYDDSGWSCNYTHPEEPESQIDLIEKLAALFGSDISLTNYGEFVRLQKFHLQYEDIKTRTAFSIAPMVSFKNSKDSDVAGDYSSVSEIAEVNRCRKFVTDQVKGMKYDISYLNIDYNSPYFEYMCTHANNDIYYSDLGIVQKKMLNRYEVSFEADAEQLDMYTEYLRTRRNSIQSDYMKLPVTLPARVRTLAKSVAGNGGNNYYKARAIQKYLKDNYKYSRSPEKADASRYVDSFLFDTKEGFCMHFATAMAIMARCADIPSRVVTGYCVHYDSSPDENVIHYVEGSAAHTWAEVYIEGIGWVVCEATPKYADNAAESWRKMDVGEYGYIMTNGAPCPEGTGIAVSTGGDPTSSPTYAAGMQDGKDSSEDARDSMTKASGNDGFRLGMTGMIVLAAIAVIVLLVIVYVLINMYHRKLYSNANNTIKCRILIDEIVILLRKNGCSMKRSNTLGEFAAQNEHILGEYTDAFASLIDTYQAARFGKKNIAAESVADAENLVKALREKLSTCHFPLRRV